MSTYKCFQIELTRGYDYVAFREDLKKLYNMAGVSGENTVFLFTDTQVSIVPLIICILGTFQNIIKILIKNFIKSLTIVSLQGILY